MTRRGQTLVLGVLFLFLTTLLVLITLSVGQRTRDRIEGQIAADAAAYSDAVVTARTLNQMALINRTRVSVLVVMLGVQSLISWSGHHRSHLAATATALKEAEAPYLPCCGNPFCPQNACSCAELGRLHGAEAAVGAEQARIAAEWNALDIAAAQYTSDLFNASIRLYDSTEEAVANLDDKLKNQLLAKAIVKSASSDLDAPDKGDWKSIDETKDANECEDVGGLWCAHHHVARIGRTVMLGTRGWHFVAARTEKENLIEKKLESLVRPFNPLASIDTPEKKGGAGVGPDREPAQKVGGSPYMDFIGEDHGGKLNLVWPSACIPSGGTADVTAGWVKSNHSDMGGDEHRYAGSSEPAARHDISGHGGERDSWPWSFEYNFHELGKPKNDFGQPKLYAIVERTFSRENPWDLTVGFGFTDHGARLASGDAPQVVLSSAIAYYHRPGAWKEPPCLWNPFWRATLYAPDDDYDKQIARAGHPAQAETIKRLIKAGMAGTR